MPESLSELQKKKKTRFPISRIKKLIQQNDEIGKTAATVPVILSKSIELFLTDLIGRLCKELGDKKGGKIQIAHLKGLIDREKDLYGFLRPVLKEDKSDE